MIRLAHVFKRESSDKAKKTKSNAVAAIRTQDPSIAYCINTSGK